MIKIYKHTNLGILIACMAISATIGFWMGIRHTNTNTLTPQKNLTPPQCPQENTQSFVRPKFDMTRDETLAYLADRGIHPQEGRESHLDVTAFDIQPPCRMLIRWRTYADYILIDSITISDPEKKESFVCTNKLLAVWEIILPDIVPWLNQAMLDVLTEPFGPQAVKRRYKDTNYVYGYISPNNFFIEYDPLFKGN